MKFTFRGFALAMAAVLVTTLPMTALAQKDDKKRSKQEKAEIEALVKLADAAMAGQAPASDLVMNITPFYLKAADQRVYAPFVLDVVSHAKADTAMLIRVVRAAAAVTATTTTTTTGATTTSQTTVSTSTSQPKRGEKVEYPWEDVHFIPAASMAADKAILNRVFMAVPGVYDVFVTLKERLPEKGPKGQVAKAGWMKTTVTVPDLFGEFTTSSVIVADKVDQLTAPLSQDDARVRPFAFGAQEMTPAQDINFSKAEELSVFFQVYNPGLNANGKPDVLMEYNFLRKEGAEDKFFNKTNPQAINESNLPPQFDPAKFPVPGGITVPLKSFPEGEYRLEIKITDKTSNKVLTQNVKFNVKA